MLFVKFTVYVSNKIVIFFQAALKAVLGESVARGAQLCSSLDAGYGLSCTRAGTRGGQAVFGCIEPCSAVSSCIRSALSALVCS